MGATNRDDGAQADVDDQGRRCLVVMTVDISQVILSDFDTVA
jgi:hypothetical protein